MQARHHRNLHGAGEALGLEPQQIGGGQVEEVGGEVDHVLAGGRGQAEGEAIFRPARQAHGRDGDEVADLLGGLVRGRRRINPDIRADGPAQMVDQPVQGLGRSVARVVEVAREEGDAKRLADHKSLDSDDAQ